MGGVINFLPSDLKRVEDVENAQMWQHHFDVCYGTFSVINGSTVACSWHEHMKRTRTCSSLDHRWISTDSEWRRPDSDEALQWMSIELGSGCWRALEMEAPTN